MKNRYAALVLAIFIGGCGGSPDDEGAVSGVHFQGRDCLSCHNVDLAENSHLQIGGTVFEKIDGNKNNLNETCSERLHIEFGFPSEFSTKSFNDVNSAGFNGRGNVFALIKDMPLSGTYTVSIVQDNGNVLAAYPDHPFLGGFDPRNPSDVNNMYSCNACHQAAPNNKGGAKGVLFATGCISKKEN